MIYGIISCSESDKKKHYVWLNGVWYLNGDKRIKYGKNVQLVTNYKKEAAPDEETDYAVLLKVAKIFDGKSVSIKKNIGDIVTVKGKKAPTLTLTKADCKSIQYSHMHSEEYKSFVSGMKQDDAETKSTKASELAASLVNEEIIMSSLAPTAEETSSDQDPVDKFFVSLDSVKKSMKNALLRIPAGIFMTNNDMKREYHLNELGLDESVINKIVEELRFSHMLLYMETYYKTYDIEASIDKFSFISLSQIIEAILVSVAKNKAGVLSRPIKLTMGSMKCWDVGTEHNDRKRRQYESINSFIEELENYGYDSNMLDDHLKLTNARNNIHIIKAADEREPDWRDMLKRALKFLNRLVMILDSYVKDHPDETANVNA